MSKLPDRKLKNARLVTLYRPKCWDDGQNHTIEIATVDNLADAEFLAAGRGILENESGLIDEYRYLIVGNTWYALPLLEAVEKPSTLSRERMDLIRKLPEELRKQIKCLM